MDIYDKCDTDEGYFGFLRVQDDSYYSRPILEPLPGTEALFEGKKCVQWSLNNYLGLAQNEILRQVATEAASKYGASVPMGSRMLTGNTPMHLDLENRFAEWLDKESAILFNYGYMGVIGTIASMVGKNDTIIIDKLSHASMLDATMLAAGNFRVYRHNDMNSLESHLKRVNRDRKGGVLIVSEGVYGMQGDLANLPDICALKEKYDARLFIDDAHGFGVMGGEGRGTAAHFDVHDKVDLYFGTFAKAFAAIGGVTVAPKKAVDWIRYNARPQVFAKSLPMIYVEVLKKTLSMIQEGDHRREKMWANAKKLQKGLRELGYHVGNVLSPITPVYVPAGDVTVCAELVKRIRDAGIFINPVMYPVVPKGIMLFRMIPTAAHTDEDIQRTVDVYRQVRDDMNLKLEYGEEANL